MDNMLKAGMWQRLRIDHNYRSRFIHTICIYWASFSMGLCSGMIGPTFPDLRQIAKQDLHTGSWLYTFGSVGNIIGALAGGGLYGRLNRLLLLGIAIAVAGVSMAVEPWCQWFPLMVFVGSVGKVSFGVFDIGGNAEMISIWEGEEGSMYMQAYHFFYAIGGIVSPLLAKPFLAPRTCVPFSAGNQTANSTGNPSFNNGMSTTGDNNTTFSYRCYETFGETRIHIPYLISGLIMMSGCIPFFVMYFTSYRTLKSVLDADRKYIGERSTKMSLKMKIFLICLLSSLLGFSTAIEDSFIGYLMTFCLRNYNWSKEYGSYASSTHWAAFSVGRFVGMFSARLFSSGCLLFTHTTFNVISITGLLIGSMFMNQTLPWIFIPLTGLSISVVFPCIFTWTETRFMKVTGMVASIFVVSAAGIRMINPLVFGYMMDNYSPLWFVYLLLVEAILCLLLLIAIHITGKLCLDKQAVDREQEMFLLSG